MKKLPPKDSEALVIPTQSESEQQIFVSLMNQILSNINRFMLI